MLRSECNLVHITELFLLTAVIACRLHVAGGWPVPTANAPSAKPFPPRPSGGSGRNTSCSASAMPRAMPITSPASSRPAPRQRASVWRSGVATAWSAVRSAPGDRDHAEMQQAKPFSDKGSGSSQPRPALCPDQAGGFRHAGWCRSGRRAGTTSPLSESTELILDNSQARAVDAGDSLFFMLKSGCSRVCCIARKRKPRFPR
jgi:hypothetical protein